MTLFASSPILSLMKRVALLCALILLVPVLTFPLITSAKAKGPKGYSHERGKELTVSEPLGWPTKTTNSTWTDTSIESLPGMSVVRVKPYNPWWHIWGGIPATTTVTVGGLPADTDLHVYTRGYRDHAVAHSSKQGTLTLDYASKQGQQFIIKANPSTYHINLGGNIWNLYAAGGDCKSIGIWFPATKTCALTTDVNKDGNRTIAIEDNGITLDGKDPNTSVIHKVIGVGTDDGVYTDMSNVTVKNLNVTGFARGIVYVATHIIIVPSPTGGSIESVILTNLAQNVHIEGMSELSMSNVTSIGADTGLFIEDFNSDGLPTYGIKAKGSTIKNAALGAYVDNVDPVTFTQNNWEGNGTDISQVASGMTLANITDRGNYWKKFTDCKQDPAPANPNHCANKYDVPSIGSDALPWACANAWGTGSPCPRVTPPPPPPSGGGTDRWMEVKDGSTFSNPLTATFYQDSAKTIKLKELPNGWVLELLDDASDPYKVRDVADEVVGFIDSGSLREATTQAQKDLFNARAATSTANTRTERLDILAKAVAHYWADSSTDKNLYSGNDFSVVDKNDGDKDIFLNQHLATEGQFPIDLYLATLIEESGGALSDFDNELITFDYGHAPGQLTVAGYQKDVTYLQLLLKKLGYYTGTPNGSFDDSTVAAVKSFQTSKSLTTSGDVGPLTLPLLNTSLEANRLQPELSSIPTSFKFKSFLVGGETYSRDKTAGMFDNRSGVVGLVVYPCKDYVDQSSVSSQNYYKNCYKPNGVGFHYNMVANTEAGTPLISYYQNTEQSLYSSVKNGLSVLLQKYASKRGLVKNSLLVRPWLTKGAITIDDNDLKAFLALRGYNGFGRRLGQARNTEGEKVSCYYLFDNPLNSNYLSSVAYSLLQAHDVFPTSGSYATSSALYQKLLLVDKNKTELCIGSPAYLQIIDGSNNLTGYDGSKIVDQISNVVYDDINYEEASILVPNSTYTFRVVGKESGTYDFVIANFTNSSSPIQVKMDNIPSTIGSIHEYKIDWANLTDTGGVTIKVDQNGDGTFEKTVVGGKLMNGDQFLPSLSSDKVTICHRPPGNPSNSKTLFLPASAISAHMAHGDKKGECKNEKPDGDKEKEKEKDEGKDEREVSDVDDKRVKKEGKKENKENKDSKENNRSEGKDNINKKGKNSKSNSRDE